MPATAPRDTEADAERQALLGSRQEATADNSPADQEAAHSGGSGFQRNLGALEAFAIVISIVIGSGVFTSPGSIDTNVPSPGAALGVWLVGGVLAWTGAATLVELGTAIPGEGGVQPFLQYIYGDVFGFLAAWTWLVAVMPATLAILSIVFVESLFSATSSTAVGPSVSSVSSASSVLDNPLIHKLLSVAVLALVSLANSVSTKASARLNNFFVATKFFAIVGVVVAAVAVIIVQTTTRSDGDAPPPSTPGGHDWTSNWFAPRVTLNPDGSRTDWTQLSSWALLGHYSAALYGALWAYSGWDKAIYVSAELSAPAKQLPLAINAALPIIVLCFLAANASYYILLPWKVVSTTDSVAVTAFAQLLGPAVGIVAAVVICLVVAGSLLGNSFVAGRMAVSAAHKNWIHSGFAVLGRIGRPDAAPPSPGDAEDGHDTEGPAEPNAPNATSAEPSSPPKPDSAGGSDAPINALVLSFGLGTLYILLGNFRALLTFNGLGEFTFFFLTVLGAVILRFREPNLARPYKPMILVPILFAAVSGFVVVRGAVFAPVQAIVLIVLWLLGLVYYYVR